MKNLIIKLDRKVLDLLTAYIRRWIERKEYKKHKVDFMIQMEWVQFGALIVWAIVIPAALYVAAGQIIGATVHVVVWSALAVMEWFSIQMTIHKLKPLHDWMWAQRANPAVYEMEKSICEKMFLEGRRKRLETHAVMLGITLALFIMFRFVSGAEDPINFVWQYLLVNSMANSVRRYIWYVFDFDPPKKRKTVSEAVSELVRKLWGDTVGGFAPQPGFASIR